MTPAPVRATVSSWRPRESLDEHRPTSRPTNGPTDQLEEIPIADSKALCIRWATGRRHDPPFSVVPTTGSRTPRAERPQNHGADRHVLAPRIRRPSSCSPTVDGPTVRYGMVWHVVMQASVEVAPAEARRRAAGASRWADIHTDTRRLPPGTDRLRGVTLAAPPSVRPYYRRSFLVRSTQPPVSHLPGATASAIPPARPVAVWTVVCRRSHHAGQNFLITLRIASHRSRARSLGKPTMNAGKLSAGRSDRMNAAVPTRREVRR